MGTTVASSSLTMTVADAQTQLCLSRSRVYELIRSGELPSIKIGRSRRVLRASLEAFLKQLLEEQENS
ncbi:MAG: helix-turn-helix domain-containing protein [Armatimonadetes bacterium]|nr:helix-turn-helix domain-containing protein [Armatimonadota bacterium]